MSNLEADISLFDQVDLLQLPSLLPSLAIASLLDRTVVALIFNDLH
jgi:hypothetical protein